MADTESPPSFNWLAILDRPIAFHRVFVDLGGGVYAGLMLSQAFYWARRTTEPDGWFYKTQDEWYEETGLGRREQEAARASLRKTPFWEEERRGIPARLYFRINLQALLHQLPIKNGGICQSRMAESANQVCTHVPNKNGGICQSISEITSEITAETHPPPFPPPSDIPIKPKASKRCPPAYTPPSALREWAHTKFPELDFEEALEAMRDYEFAAGHTDWDATLRTWLRTEAKRSRAGPGSLTREERRRLAEEQSNRALEEIVNGTYTGPSAWHPPGRDGTGLSHQPRSGHEGSLSPGVGRSAP